MPKQMSRRAFVQLMTAAPSALVVGFNPRTRAWATDSPNSQRPLDDLPQFDGALLFDNASRDATSLDWGRYVKRRPIAALKPGSVLDFVRIVQYANKRSLKVAMRGQGNSVSGQAQVEGGIVIDSSTLNDVRWHGDTTLDTQPGVLWGDVAKTTNGTQRMRK